MMLIFGPTTDDRAVSIGGTTVLCDQMVDYINQNKIKNATYIKTNKFENSFINFVSILWSLLTEVNKAKVIVVNASDNLMFYFCPLAYFCAKIFKKKIVVRTFGGNFDLFYKNLNVLGKTLIRKTVLSADIIFSETKHQIYSFYEDNTAVSTSVQWFPNCRVDPKITKRIQKNKELKLLFIGTISEDKGVDDLIELNRRLASKTVDFYGYTKEQKYLNNKDFNYKGVLDPAQVLKTMQSYDYLVLPTTWYGEGYPGVIIEAFSIGLPVISTNFRAIPELITHDYNGFLVEPGNVDSLISLVSLIEEGVDYSSLSAHSKALFLESFESNLLHKAFFKKLEQLG